MYSSNIGPNDSSTSPRSNFIDLNFKPLYNCNAYIDWPWNCFSEGDKGPIPGIDYHSTVTAEFTKMKKNPEVGRWLQATSTVIARYIFTELEEVKMKNNGFLLRYVTDSGEDATHFVSFDSPALADPEFRPFMDICYIPCKIFKSFNRFIMIYY